MNLLKTKTMKFINTADLIYSSSLDLNSCLAEFNGQKLDSRLTLMKMPKTLRFTKVKEVS